MSRFFWPPIPGGLEVVPGMVFPPFTSRLLRQRPFMPFRCLPRDVFRRRVFSLFRVRCMLVWRACLWPKMSPTLFSHACSGAVRILGGVSAGVSFSVFLSTWDSELLCVSFAVPPPPESPWPNHRFLFTVFCPFL